MSTAGLTALIRCGAISMAWAALGRHTVPLLRGWRRDRPDTPVRGSTDAFHEHATRFLRGSGGGHQQVLSA